MGVTITYAYGCDCCETKFTRSKRELPPEWFFVKFVDNGGVFEEFLACGKCAVTVKNILTSNA